MKKGELTRRRASKARMLLGMNSAVPFRPIMTTTEALAYLSAGCGPVSFHRLLTAEGMAVPRTGFDKGHDFQLQSEYGCGTYSINHHSFRWSGTGVRFIAKMLQSKSVRCVIPPELGPFQDLSG